MRRQEAEARRQEVNPIQKIYFLRPGSCPLFLSGKNRAIAPQLNKSQQYPQVYFLAELHI
ncbi:MULTISPECIES: hypothetical protein [unclassified Nostoc]|uniref:hypothetical protein n=1 Tax=unclassified Nostoc TaxID=2593658 RepID=UPI001D2CCAA0|nr:hypothetical protein [Nostoc sp. JL23]MBN3879273.1 hypothetical protein [Nostoc sp. JL23]